MSEDGQAPTVSVSTPAVMMPPTSAPIVVVAPGGALTFSGSADDDEGLNTVEISLRNTTTRENLATDGTWGVDAIQGWHASLPST